MSNMKLLLLLLVLLFSMALFGQTTTPPLSYTAPVHQVTLTWTGGTGPNYAIFRATTTGGPYQPIASTDQLKFVDLNVVGGQTYFYRIANYSGCGLVADFSDETSVTIPPDSATKPAVTIIAQ